MKITIEKAITKTVEIEIPKFFKNKNEYNKLTKDDKILSVLNLKSVDYYSISIENVSVWKAPTEIEEITEQEFNQNYNEVLKRIEL